MVQFLSLRLPVKTIRYALPVILLLKITLFEFSPNLESFLIHTPEVLPLPSNECVLGMLKLHGICKQDPLIATILFGAVIVSAAFLSHLAQTPAKSDQTVTKKIWEFNYKQNFLFLLRQKSWKQTDKRNYLHCSLGL